MAADRESSFVLKFDGDAGTLTSVLSSLKAQIKSDVADLERTAGKVQLFQGLQEELAAARANFDASKVKVDQLAASININLGGASKELQAQLRDAQKEMQGAAREAAKTQTAVDRLAGQLKLAGVNTRDLAGEQARLAAALKQAQTAAANQAAQQLLGVRTLRDIAPEVNRLQLAYNQLARSGKLSSDEIALAQEQLRTKITQLRSSVTSVAGAAKDGTPTLAGFFTGSLLPAIGLTASIAGVVAGMRSAVSAANDFTEGVAQIGTVTKLSQSELDDLGQGARDLAKEIGIGVNDALHGLFELIRSGVPPENALSVLKVSAEAAKAALTDTGTGVKAANLLIDGFGASLDQLPALFDKIIAGAHNGGATLKEFADNGGQLIAVAKSAGISFDDLLATLTVMVDKSGNAERSISDLSKIIAKLDTSEARSKLRDLGIEGDSLVSIFQQIGAKGLSLEDVLGLGLSATGAKAAASLAALTNGSKDLPEKLDAIAHSAGSTQEALDKLSKTDNEKIKKLTAAWDDLKISLGLVAAQATPAIQGLTALAQAAVKPNASMQLLTQRARDAQAALPGVKTGADAAAQGMSTAGQAAADLSTQVASAADRSRKAAADLTDFGAKLATEIQALQQGSARDLADATARADAQIAALDRSVQATADTAAKTLAIQTKLNADKLAIIEKGEKDITAAIDKEVAARTVLARKQGQDEQKIAVDAANLRINALAPVLQQYQAFYADLITQEQAYASKVNAITQERLDFNQSIEKRLFDIRIAGLSAFDQYVAKVQESERLISLAREAGLNQDLVNAKKFTDQALALTDTITTAVSTNGSEIVSSFDVQQTKIKLTKEAADAYNGALDKAGDSAKAGADATKKSLDDVSVRLKDLQGQYDALKKTIADGLAIRVNVDQQSINNAVGILDELTKPRTVDVTVRVNGSIPEGAVPASSDSAPDTSTGGGNGEHFARGGMVRRPSLRPQALAPRGFAFGGPVFRGPKVPGTGDRDTYRTLLREGSFVVRKRASAHYGDRLMHAVARFAGGGSVNPLPASTVTSLISAAFQPGVFNDPALTALQRYLAGIKVQPPPADPAAGSGTPTAADVIAYALSILDIYGRTPQGLTLIKNLGPDMRQRISLLQTNPKDQATQDYLLKEASYLGQNLALIDYVDRSSSPFGPLRKPYTFEDFQAGVRRFARGGPASDTVPALLTPGEFVVKKPAVRKLGVDFFSRLNRMEIPKLDLAALFAPPARVAHFAEGGLVGNAPAGARFANTPSGGGSITVNLNAGAETLFSKANVQRFLVPVLQDLQRRSSTSKR